MKAIILSGLILMSLTLLSCEREDNVEIIKAPGILSWTGEYEVDGCGFFLTISGQEYKPENESIIKESFKNGADANVMVEYQLLNRQIESWCGDMPAAILTDGIKIISIEEDLKFYTDRI